MNLICKNSNFLCISKKPFHEIDIYKSYTDPETAEAYELLLLLFLLPFILSTLEAGKWNVSTLTPAPGRNGKPTIVGCICAVIEGPVLFVGVC